MEFRLEADEGEESGLGTGVTLHRMTAWLLTSTVLFCANIGMSFPASAQQSSPTSVQSSAVQFSIPAQPLPSAINAFIRATGWQVGYSTRITDGLRSTAVTGAMPPAQALRALLAGTGINVRFTGANTATLVSQNVAAGGAATVPGAIQLDQIDVQGAGNPNSTMTPMPEYAGGQVATGGQVGLLGNRSLMDTPFNQTSFTQKTIQNQQAKTLNDVLINDPSVNVTSPTSSSYDSMSIRGFSAGTGGDAVSVNGLYGIVPFYTVGTAGVERVEVLKGPSALLNGMPIASALGGSINLVTKRAPDEPLAQLTASYASRSQLGTQIDVGRRFGENKEFGVRFNGSYRNGDGPVNPNSQEQRFAILGLDYRGERVRVSADLGYQETNTNAPVRFVLLNSGMPVPQAPDASKNFAPPWNYFHNKDLFGMVRGEVDITDNITAYAAVGARRSDLDSAAVSPFISNSQGDWTATPLASRSYGNALSGTVGLRATVDTGPINHTLSVNAAQSESDWGTGYALGSLVRSNIYNPVNVPNPNLRVSDPRKQSDATQSSIGVADTLSILDKRVQLTVGIRRQQVAAGQFDTTTGAEISRYNEYAWSPAYALVVKPWQNVSLYANYIEGLEPGTIVDPLYYANGGQVFPPYQTKQYEAGAKIDWGRVTTTISAFQIARPSTFAVPGTPLPTLALNGEQVNRGIEFNVFGEVAEGVRLLGGMMLLDARLTKTAGGANDGKRAPGTSDLNFVLGGEWDLPFVRGLTVTGRVNHTSEAFYDSANLMSVPAWTRFDFGARYTFDAPWNGKPITIRFDVQNAFDKSYWLSDRGTLLLAPPRTYLLSTTFNF